MCCSTNTRWTCWPAGAEKKQTINDQQCPTPVAPIMATFFFLFCACTSRHIPPMIVSGFSLANGLVQSHHACAFGEPILNEFCGHRSPTEKSNFELCAPSGQTNFSKLPVMHDHLPLNLGALFLRLESKFYWLDWNGLDYLRNGEGHMSWHRKCFRLHQGWK